MRLSEAVLEGILQPASLDRRSWGILRDRALADRYSVHCCCQIHGVAQDSIRMLKNEMKGNRLSEPVHEIGSGLERFPLVRSTAAILLLHTGGAMAPYSMDLRTRVLRDSDTGMPSKEVGVKIRGESRLGGPRRAATPRAR